MAKFVRISSEECRRRVTEGFSSYSDDEDINYTPTSDDDNSSSDEEFVPPTPNQVVEEEDQDTNSDSDATDSQPSSSRGRPRGSGRPRGRGRPRGSFTRGQPAPARSRSAPPTDTVTYSQVFNSSTQNNFRFVPPRGPGVTADLNEFSSVLDCFMSLIPEELLIELRDDINEYAKLKCHVNTPSRKRSMYGNWQDVTLTEVYRYLAVLIVMGMDDRPRFKDYWSTKEYLKCDWFRDMFSRERFEAIHHTMLHCSEVDANGKAKIEPFVFKIVGRFQDAFYPFQEISID